MTAISKEQRDEGLVDQTPSSSPDKAEHPMTPTVGSPMQDYIPTDIKPTNHIRVSRPIGLIKGSWLLDPSVEFPQSFLPPLVSGETEDTRRNIGLIAHLGSIDADVFIIRKKRTKDLDIPKPIVVFTASSGWVVLRIVSCGSSYKLALNSNQPYVIFIARYSPTSLR